MEHDFVSLIVKLWLFIKKEKDANSNGQRKVEYCSYWYFKTMVTSLLAQEYRDYVDKLSQVYENKQINMSRQD